MLWWWMKGAISRSDARGFDLWIVGDLTDLFQLERKFQTKFNQRRKIPSKFNPEKYSHTGMSQEGPGLQTEERPRPAPVQTPPAAAKKKRTARPVDDSASYNRTVGGKLKLKGVEFKAKKGKKKGVVVAPKQAPQAPEEKKEATELLLERCKKKSDRYCMV